MRYFLLFPLIVAMACSASAQEYAQQYSAAPQIAPQQQVSDNYSVTAPIYNQPHYVPQQPAQTQPQPYVGQPADYGQSVITDIRQMNF